MLKKMLVLHLLTVLCGMLAANIEGQTSATMVVLRGEIESFEIKSDTPSSVDLTVNLEMNLLNNGSKPVMFLKTKPPEIRGWALAKGKEASPSFDDLFFSYFGESMDTSAEWTVLRNDLNQSSPPPDKVFVLQPNESWKWKETAKISLPKSEKDKVSYSKTESWENVKQLSQVWLRGICQVWSLNLEPKSSNDRTQKPFGHQLQKRWENAGLLLLDGLKSEPIMLDLKNAVVR